jgi:hypothetical protein
MSSSIFNNDGRGGADVVVARDGDDALTFRLLIHYYYYYSFYFFADKPYKLLYKIRIEVPRRKGVSRSGSKSSSISISSIIIDCNCCCCCFCFCCCSFSSIIIFYILSSSIIYLHCMLVIPTEDK